MQAIQASIDALEPEQRDAVVYDHKKPLLISAGAGSGKTRVMTLRIAYFLDKLHIVPSTILALTFSKKATEELQARIGQLIPQARGGVTVKTYHAFCLGFITGNWAKLGFKAHPIIWDYDQPIKYMKEVLDEMNLAPDDFNRLLKQAGYSNAGREGDPQGDQQDDPSPEKEKKFVDEEGPKTKVARYLLGIRKSTAQGKVYRNDSVRQQTLLRFEQKKKAVNGMEQDDMVPYALQLFRKFPEEKQKAIDQYHYVMVDEFQDTDKKQIRLIQDIVPTWRQSVTVCGDVNQSIYGFRGDISSTNFDDFLRKWPEAETIKLQKNFRSTQVIVAASAAIIKNNGASAVAANDVYTSNAAGEKITQRGCSSEESEVNYVGEEIQRLRKEGIAYSKMAVLFRARNVGWKFEKKFKELKIPLYNSSPTWRNSEFLSGTAKNIASYISLAINEYDNDSFDRVINKPKRGLGSKALKIISQSASRNRCSALLEASRRLASTGGGGLSAQQIGDLRQFLKAVDGLKSDLDSMEAKDVIKQVYERVYKVRQAASMEAEDQTKKMTDSMSEDLVSLGHVFDTFLCTGERSTKDVLKKFVALVMKGDKEISKEKAKDHVRLTTIHQSKGLEWDYVWLVRFNENMIPTTYQNEEDESPEEYALNSAKHVKEERRCAYVGVSRAKVKLNITFLVGGFWGDPLSGVGEPWYPSRFLEEIPNQLFEDKMSNPNSAAASQSQSSQQSQENAKPHTDISADSRARHQPLIAKQEPPSCAFMTGSEYAVQQPVVAKQQQNASANQQQPLSGYASQQPVVVKQEQHGSANQQQALSGYSSHQHIVAKSDPAAASHGGFPAQQHSSQQPLVAKQERNGHADHQQCNEPGRHGDSYGGMVREDFGGGAGVKARMPSLFSGPAGGREPQGNRGSSVVAGGGSSSRAAGPAGGAGSKSVGETGKIVAIDLDRIEVEEAGPKRGGGGSQDDAIDVEEFEMETKRQKVEPRDGKRARSAGGENRGGLASRSPQWLGGGGRYAAGRSDGGGGGARGGSGSVGAASVPSAVRSNGEGGGRGGGGGGGSQLNIGRGGGGGGGSQLNIGRGGGGGGGSQLNILSSQSQNQTQSQMPHPSFVGSSQNPSHNQDQNQSQRSSQPIVGSQSASKPGVRRNDGWGRGRGRPVMVSRRF